MKNQKALISVVAVIVLSTMVILSCSRKDDIQKGMEAIEKGDYEKALKSFTASLALDSLNPEIHYNMSLAYAHLDSIEQACRHFYHAYTLGSPQIEGMVLKEMLARDLDLDPFNTTRVPMKNMNQFKGVFSPDGKSLAVAAATRDVANIYIITPKGKVITQITKRGMNTDPDFSPNGEHIAFSSDADGDDEIYLYNIKTKELANLTDNTAKDFSPSFSPDGEEIVFISNMDHEFKWEIYKINVHNKHIKRLTNNNFWDGFPKFTQDGKKITFSSKRNGSEDIYIMNTSGGGERTFYATEADENDPKIVGNLLYFKSNTSGEWVIYRYDLESEEITPLSKDNYPNWNPRISDDGSYLCLARKVKNRWHLYYLDLKSGLPAEQIAQKIEKKYDIQPAPDEEEP